MSPDLTRQIQFSVNRMARESAMHFAGCPNTFPAEPSPPKPDDADEPGDYVELPEDGPGHPGDPGLF